MKKMAPMFQVYKKRLYQDYIKKNMTPDFNSPNYAKLRPFWDNFVRFKMSEEAQERVRKTKRMPDARPTTIRWDQVATKPPFLSGKRPKKS